ncbi:PucR family transcriptional regulator ligand-binding domain-containing protein [Quadrisphaera sp. RL12-1S]|nr:PucR family transcriptional regulator ligand-binding domain-containing protein [Quadrisphaera sp. RL12-1S]
MTLRSALEHPVVRAAAPELLTPGVDLDVPVRWVHSSEIYEIGPLLTGGELLLTTGLGVAGADAGARRHYVRDLAARGLAALAVEVGRSLPALPVEMADEAARRGLPLVVLREVVPFIRISEVLNTLIVDGSTTRLRFTERVTAAVEGAQAEERGLAGLLAAVGLLLDRPLVLVSAGGALVSASGTTDDRTAWQVVDAPTAQQGTWWCGAAGGVPSWRALLQRRQVPRTTTSTSPSTAWRPPWGSSCCTVGAPPAAPTSSPRACSPISWRGSRRTPTSSCEPAPPGSTRAWETSSSAWPRTPRRAGPACRCCRPRPAPPAARCCGDASGRRSSGCSPSTGPTRCAWSRTR